MARLQVENGSTAKYNVEAPYTQPDAFGRVAKQLWFGIMAGPFVRVAVSGQDSVDLASPVAGTLRAQGTSRSASVTNGALPVLVESHHGAEYNWELRAEHVYKT